MAELGRTILKAALQRATAGSEGARFIGSQLTGLQGTNLQTVLESLKSLVDTKSGNTHLHSGTYLTPAEGDEKYALKGSTGSTPPPHPTDGSAPLKYSAFLTAASGNHDTAFKNAMDTLFSDVALQRHLDLEGHLVTLKAPYTIPLTANATIRHIQNGELRAHSTEWIGTHLIKGVTAPKVRVKWSHLVFAGSSVAGWLSYDNGDWEYHGCTFRNNHTDGTAGLLATGGAHWNIKDSTFTTDDSAIQPINRTRIGIRGTMPDNKISGTTMSYFRNAIVQEGHTFICDNCHIFQGVPQESNTTTHTAGIKLTNGRVGANVSDLYLDKCFIEVSNATNPTQKTLGAITITGVNTILTRGGALGFAYLLFRDTSGGGVGTMTIEDVIVTGGNWNNSGSTAVKLTRIDPPDNFNKLLFKNIVFQENFFTDNIAPQANPVTLQKVVSVAATQHPVDFSNYFPFDGKPTHVISIAPRWASITATNVNNVDRSNSTVDIRTAASVTGQILCTATMDLPASGYLTN